MDIVRETVETLIKRIQEEVLSRTFLVPVDSFFEVTNPPSLLLQGPILVENKGRRSQASTVCKNLETMTYERRPMPRLYHLDFELVMTTNSEPELLDLQATMGRFYFDNPVLEIEDRGFLNLTELVPLGGLRRVNLSNLKQSAGKLRLEDCPIYGTAVETGRLILDRRFEFRGNPNEDRDF